MRLGELDEGEFEEKLSAGQVKYWQNGVEIPVDMVPENAITPDTVATLDADGTLHVLITPEITGTKEAVDAIRPVVDEIDQLGVTTAGTAIGLLPTTTMDLIDSALGRLEVLPKDTGLQRMGQILGQRARRKHRPWRA